MKSVEKTQEKGSSVETPAEYKVERILDKKIVGGKVFYFIKWFGYDIREATWEPTENLNCPKKIDDFEVVMKRVQSNLTSNSAEQVSYTSNLN